MICTVRDTHPTWQGLVIFACSSYTFCRYGEGAPCLKWEVVEILFPLVGRLVPAANEMWLPAWNAFVTGNATAGLSVTQLSAAGNLHGALFSAESRLPSFCLIVVAFCFVCRVVVFTSNYQ